MNNTIISVYCSISTVNEFIWGVPVLVLMLAGGIFLSFRLHFAQLHIFRLFGEVIGMLKAPRKSSRGISRFQSFSTALAATVGTGSVTGVACALCVGGKGCIFWMWVSALIGMALSYCENFLAAKHSKLSQQGRKGSGAFCYIRTIGKIPAVCYALFCVLASLGMGNMAQSSSAVSAASGGFGLPYWFCSLAVVVFCALAVSDTSRCARICEKAVPFAALLFILTSAALLLLSPLKTLNALADIFKDAFSVKACAGGTFGWFFTKVCVNGLRRGAFSHEAGLGSTCAVHSSCEDISAQMQGKLAMSEVFIDTMVICTVTALVIIVSGADFSRSDYTLTVSDAYSVFLGGAGKLFVSLCLTLFSLCTLTGWFFIGESAFACLFPEKTLIYKLIYLLCAYLGSQFPMQTVWEISDIFNALMALPNIICVLMLSKQVSAPKFRRLRGG